MACESGRVIFLSGSGFARCAVGHRKRNRLLNRVASAVREKQPTDWKRWDGLFIIGHWSH